ncbi:NADH-quinone oxidoreductase subunit H [Candidatus Berkiella cookevillensis]|uniref:Formate hydrogenlyase subunit 4 n=1 Tax=Candidatus Berkiella cookevillensis TaxID=437022 RepID=A0A0Q9YPK4_9GAMM|nr:NADH-quinone oxidoreductase subunit H [Candidatus Berkiella cookevillensis]MCS5708824.1 NADH-quinone oxidoreductase subunit H [Candidatus Berkiella cookevillensis]
MEIVLVVFQALFVLMISPLVMGWLNNCRLWLQNKSAPGIFQPYRNLRKLFQKETLVAHHASIIYRVTPYIQIGCMVFAAMLIPIFSVNLFASNAADLIALAGLFGFARFFLALAGMDIGTSFGNLGSRREMFVSFLAEPCLLMIFFGVSLLANSTSLSTVSTYLITHPLQIYPSLVFMFFAFLIVMLAENSRLPVDNPSTHLELTMIHEAMILEYSGRHLALIQWSCDLKFVIYSLIGISIFMPWGIPIAITPLSFFIGLISCVIKLFLGATFIVCLESTMAKLRIFRVTEFLSIGFLLAVLGILLHLLLTLRVS